MLEKDLDRRSLVKGAAWSAPVLAAAVAAPLAAASGDTELDINVNAECYGLTIAGVGATFPQWQITSTGAPIPAGTTFILSSSALAKVSLGNLGGLVQVDLLGGGQARITVNSDTSSLTYPIASVVGVFVATTFTMTLESLPAGYTDTNSANNSDSARLTGVSVLGATIGRCTER